MTQRHFSTDDFVEWYSTSLKEYLDKNFAGQYTAHIEDLMYATAAFTESVTTFITNQP